MKKLIFSLFACAAFAVSVNAQVVPSYGPVTLLSAGTVAASTTTEYTASVEVSNVKNVGIYCSTVLAASGTDTVILKFAKSVDGTNFETTPSISVTNTSNGATAVKSITLASVEGAKSLRLVSIANASSARVATITVKVGLKP